MILSRVLQLLNGLLGICLLGWAFSDPRFRNAEGFPDGTLCLPVSTGVALIILGWSMAGRFKKFALWFALALVGQAVSLQMIDAGPLMHYQHYIPFYRLLTKTHPILLSYLALQTAVVVAGLKTRWPTVQRWVSSNFKVWQLFGIGLVFCLSSAAVSREIPVYMAELLFAAFVQAVNLVNILLMVWSLPEEVLVSWRQRLDNFFCRSEKEETRNSSNIDRFAIVAAIWVTVLAALLNYISYERHPHIPDEVIYLFHARYLASGTLTVPAPPVPEAFSFYMIPHESHRWYSIVPPGWPAVLALGVLLGVPWVINPVLAGLSVLLTYLFFQEISDRFMARIAVFLLCISPWFIFMAMNFMSHTLTLTCALAAAVAITRARRTHKAIWGLFGGFGVGMVSLIRPLDGLIVAGVLGLWAIGVGGRRLRISSILAFVIGTIIVGAVIFPYNKQITGHPTVSPLTAYYEKYFGPKVFALGFGPDRGLNWAIDPFPGHSPIDALVNGNLNIFSVNIELFGWGTGSLILIVLLLFSGTMRRSDYFVIAIIISIAGIYSLFWYSGGPDFGARYWYLMLLPLIALTIRGVQILQRMLESGPVGSTVNGTRVIVAVLSLSVLTLINYFPWRSIDKYHHFRGMRPGIRALAAKYGFGKSLVLVRGNSSDYQSAWIHNPLNPNANAPVYAWDRDTEIRAKILQAYPDRDVWIVNGPSITHGGFEVAKRPVSKREPTVKKDGINQN